jgi:hypothetical protein
MKKYYEIKDIAVADAPVKDVDMATRTVVGYYARYGNIDHDGDMIVPGALAKTIKERGPEGKNIIPHWPGLPNYTRWPMGPYLRVK